MNKKREVGFYWVKTKNRWVICEFTGFWHFQGCTYNDENFKEIDEERIIRKEK